MVTKSHGPPSWVQGKPSTMERFVILARQPSNLALTWPGPEPKPLNPKPSTQLKRLTVMAGNLQEPRHRSPGVLAAGVHETWGFPETRGTFLRVLIIRAIVFCGLYWGCFYFGKVPFKDFGLGVE